MLAMNERLAIFCWPAQLLRPELFYLNRHEFAQPGKDFSDILETED